MIGTFRSIGPHKPGVVVHICNPSTWQVEANEFRVVLSYKENLRPVDYMRPYQKKKEEYRKGRKEEKPRKQKIKTKQNKHTQ